MKPRVLHEIGANVVTAPATVRYPDEAVPVPKGFRGRIAILDDVCIGCSKCALVCPTECIDMVPDARPVPVKGRTIVRKIRPEVRLFDCIRCGLCEEYCPTDPKAIYLTAEFSGASTDKTEVVR